MQPEGKHCNPGQQLNCSSPYEPRSYLPVTYPSLHVEHLQNSETDKTWEHFIPCKVLSSLLLSQLIYSQLLLNSLPSPILSGFYTFSLSILKSASPNQITLPSLKPN